MSNLLKIFIAVVIFLLGFAVARVYDLKKAQAQCKQPAVEVIEPIPAPPVPVK